MSMVLLLVAWAHVGRASESCRGCASRFSTASAGLGLLAPHLHSLPRLTLFASRRPSPPPPLLLPASPPPPHPSDPPSSPLPSPPSSKSEMSSPSESRSALSSTRPPTDDETRPAACDVAQRGQMRCWGTSQLSKSCCVARTRCRGGMSGGGGESFRRLSSRLCHASFATTPRPCVQPSTQPSTRRPSQACPLSRLRMLVLSRE